MVKNARIVLPEGEEPRILQATKRLVKETEVILFCLEILKKLKFILKLKGSWMVMKSLTLNIILNFEEMVAALVERRKGKMS